MPENSFGQPLGASIAGWTPRPLPARTPFDGEWCRLEPIDPSRHADALFEAYREASDGRDWTYVPIDRPDDLSAYRDHVAAQATSSDPLHFAVLDARSAAPLGTVALMRVDVSNGVIEIGHIVFSPRLKRRPAGTEAIYLLMRHVFDDLGYRRLEWKCDSLNAPSRRAAVRYGFVFEGIFRQAIVTKGRNRDTSWYALIDQDWPSVRAGLDTWLSRENFDSNGFQRRSLAEVRASIKQPRSQGRV